MKTINLIKDKLFDGYLLCDNGEQEPKQLLKGLTYGDTVVKNNIDHKEKCIFPI